MKNLKYILTIILVLPIVSWATIQTSTTLKGYFQTGQAPTQSNFTDLIDSTHFGDNWGTKTTADLPENTNLYWTQARFDTALGAKTTTNLAEGTNLYYTDVRSRSAISSTATGLTYASTTGVFSLTSGYNIPLTASTTQWNALNNASSTWLTNLLGGLNAILGNSTTTNSTTTTASITTLRATNSTLTNATTSTLAITGLANTFLAVNGSGTVIATTTPTSGASAVATTTTFMEEFLNCPSSTTGERNIGTMIAIPYSSGSIADTPGTLNHPGLCSFSDSTNAGGGVYLGTKTNSFTSLSGDELTTIFRIPLNNVGSSTIRIGFYGSTQATDPIIGHYFQLTEGTTTIYAVVKGTGGTATGTGITLSHNTWYTTKIRFNVDLTEAYYDIFDENGSSLLSYTTTNIYNPSASMAAGVNMTESTTGVGTSRLHLDYLKLIIPNPVR